MSSSPPVFKIAPGIQSYDWGKKGADSLAAQLAQESVPDFQVQDDKPYAELWMGTHPNCPSRTGSGLLKDYIASHPELIGEKVLKRFPDARNGDLPFLFKVLSIATALSIQAHPDKKLAEQLHKDKGDIYKDGNHKPEMAIALTPFRAFLNFVPPSVLVGNLLAVPEFASLVPPASLKSLASSLGLSDSPSVADAQALEPAKADEGQKGALREVFDALMTASEEKFKPKLEALVARYKKGDLREGEKKEIAELAVELEGQYPGDIGVFCVFVLNVVDLQPGEAAFLGANMPHAYINGNIIECMATSDNVVRAGLTPKLRDVSTLVEMLTYEAGPASAQLLKPTEFNDDPSTLLYDPPIDEFSVLRTHLAKDEVTTHAAIDGPSIAVVTAGEAVVSWTPGEVDGEVPVAKGDVLFLGAGVEVKIQAGKDSEIFRAFVEA